MMDKNKNLSLALFASLALNIFLLGVVGGGFIEDKPSQQEEGGSTTEDDESEQRPVASRQPAQRPGAALGDGRGERGPRDRVGDQRRGPHRPHRGGSSDLALLRQMVRIMGGPDDARIAKLRDQKKDEIREIRQKMHAAHARVYEALTAEDWNEKQLREALKALRKTTFESQAKAQEGILNLSSLMTPAEREKLRSLPAPDTFRGPKRGNRGSFPDRQQEPSER